MYPLPPLTLVQPQQLRQGCLVQQPKAVQHQQVLAEQGQVRLARGYEGGEAAASSCWTCCPQTCSMRARTLKRLGGEREGGLGGRVGWEGEGGVGGGGGPLP